VRGPVQNTLAGKTAPLAGGSRGQSVWPEGRNWNVTYCNGFWYNVGVSRDVENSPQSLTLSWKGFRGGIAKSPYLYKFSISKLDKNAYSKMTDRGSA
jgi:hypothetical protein